MRVLLADDDPIIRLTIRSALRGLGYAVADVSDGLAAWDLMQHDFHQLLITDWQMPGLNGLQLIDRIRNADLPGYVYCILLTARDAMQDRIAGLDSGADDYLVKPASLDELRARLKIGERIISLERQLREASDRLRYQANHDALTGLLNRSAIIERTHNELMRSQRTEAPMSMVVFDIDHFKSINDRYGHLSGDRVLCHVAQMLRETLRPYDLIARWGGEEFLLLLPDTIGNAAGKIAQRVCRHISAHPIQLDEENKITLTMSAGVTGTEQEDSTESVFARADAALYAAKDAGRDRVALHQAQGLEIVSELSDA